MATTASALDFFDADGHVLEHPHEFRAFAPKGWEDRVWHIETDDEGEEWVVVNGSRRRSNFMAQAGTAGMSLADRERAQRGELRYTEIRPAAWDAKMRLEDMAADGIRRSVLYPTMLLGVQSYRDVEFADVMCRTYNDWLSGHVQQGDRRLFGVAIVPQQSIELAAREIRRAGKLPGIVGVLLRPNPTEDWKPFNHDVYDPLWRAACDAGLPIGLHPFLAADLPGACVGLRLHHLRTSAIESPEGGSVLDIDNIYFTQAIANPFDMMTSMTFLLAGGVCERFPDLKLAFLEANGGWLVPWLERLDHHYEIFAWDVPVLKRPPSEYFRRQCWISFDADESTLAFTARNPRCGADRIIWASDYPHPDAKFPGVTAELAESIASLSAEEQQRIAGENAAALYGLR